MKRTGNRSRRWRAGAASAWPDQVSVVAARCLTRPAPADALLIRPDGYIAWAAGPDAPDRTGGLDAALRSWFGPAGR